MLPILVPVSATGYTMEQIYAERAGLELYTGESMINQAPYVLQHVYTPYVIGGEYNLTEEGWLYGTELTDGEGNPSYVIGGEEQIGLTSGIRLDPEHKSDVPLYQSQTQYVTFYKPLGEGFWHGLVQGFLDWIRGTEQTAYEWGLYGDGYPLSVVTSEQFWQIDQMDTKQYPTWAFSGYRYELDPMLRINTQNGTDQKAVDDAKLSIVWYDLDGQEGISGGLVLYNSKTNAILASYTAAEIVANYNSLSQNASKFRLDFDGTIVNMWIRFDPDVLINNLDLSQSFSLGKWTVSFTSASADTYLDLQNSNTFASSLGSMLQTYIDIFTISLPNVGTEWNLVLWIICVMPLGLSVILFLSRFGLAGLGAGILGAVFAGGVLT